jgi:hypothetical protein
VAAIFTDVAGLDRYEPRGLDFAIMDGMALFPLLQDARVGSVLLNPGNAPRGEFYSNEIQTIVDGIRRLQH